MEEICILCRSVFLLFYIISALLVVQPLTTVVRCTLVIGGNNSVLKFELNFKNNKCHLYGTSMLC